MIACNTHNMRNPIIIIVFTDVGICMLNFDLVSILFSTSIPTSFNILVKMFLHLFHWFLLSVATRRNLLAFVQSSTSLAYLGG